MEFLAFLVAYGARRRLDQAGRFDAERLWRKGFALGHRVAPGKEAGLGRGLLIIAVPTLILVLSELCLRSYDWSLAVHPFAFLLLLGLMGAPGLASMLTAYTDSWRKGDMQAAWRQVCDFLPPDERGLASSPEQMHRALTKALIVEIFERYFVVAFWYLVAGVGGAFLARALIALKDHWPHAAARPGFAGLANTLNYVPARLLGLTFGVAGDLAGWLREGRAAVLSFKGNNRQVLMLAASSALTGYELEPERFSRMHPQDWPDFGDRSLAAIRGLLNRSMLVWICAFALLVIAGVV